MACVVFDSPRYTLSVFEVYFISLRGMLYQSSRYTLSVFEVCFISALLL